MDRIFPSTLILFLPLILGSCSSRGEYQNTQNDFDLWDRARVNGVLVNEGLERCRLFVDGWLQHADPKTGLIPRNLDKDKDIWNAKDAAADNYPFMVLTAALTDEDLFQGRMLEMLEAEEELTSRVGHLPDTYQFSKSDFQKESIDMDQIIFGASEYIKDGLLPLTEWLGESPWLERLLDMLDDIWDHAPVETKFGNIPSNNVEVNGEMLQILSRIYWMTDEDDYLEWAIRLGDYYLLGSHHPSRDFESLRLRDHGCEIISGLCELYATLHFADAEKKQTYQQPLRELLDKTLEVGRNQDGLFYDVVNPQTGEVIRDRVADNFGYNLNGFYTLYQLDSISEYRDATRRALNVLAEKYRNHAWEGTSADGYADAIEGALNLYNREPLASTKSWLDSEIKVMWGKQLEDGVIEGWHGDGNFARTTIMYALWKTKGVTAHPWRDDLELGAVMSGDTIWLSIRAQNPWQGILKFDGPRHRDNMHLPYDWPRINQFPEWFTVEKEQHFKMISSDQEINRSHTGDELSNGMPVELEDGELQIKLWQNGL